MEIWDFIIWSLTETAKNILIFYGILGYGFRKGHKQWVAVVCAVFLVGIVNFSKYDALFFKTVYGFIVIFILFRGKILKKIEASILQYILISGVDLLIWSILTNILGSAIYEISDMQYYIRWGSEFIACFFWLFLIYFLKEKRNRFNGIFENFSMFYFVIVLCVLLGLAFMAGMAQLNLLEKINERMKEVYLSVSSAILVLFMILASLFLYMVYSKKQLEIKNSFAKKSLEVQKMYYENILQYDENIMRFKHDVTKHINIMNLLCESNKTSELKEYIKTLSVNFVENITIINTGNLVADYFVNRTIIELKKEDRVKYEIVGRFPQKLNISNSDLCILIGNAMENAMAALKEVERDRQLVVIIKNVQNHLFLSILNSISPISSVYIEELIIRKKKYGYGITNMIQVIQNYNGEIEFNIRDNMFIVDITIW